MVGYVYFIIEEPFTGCVKVGKTDRQPHIRSRELSTGTPRNLVVYKYVSCESPNKLEFALHAHLKKINRWVVREWFKLDMLEIDDLYMLVLKMSGVTPVLSELEAWLLCVEN